MADLVSLDEVLAHLNMDEDPPGDTSELELFIDAATAHVEQHYGTLPSATYTEALRVVDDLYGSYQLWLNPLHWPVTAVTSATGEDGTAYTSEFTVSTDGRRIRHESIGSGEWTVVYTAGHTIPADLKLAVLEDIRGIFQPGQIGPPADFGAFGIDTGDAGAGRRPIDLWPRIDGWISRKLGPAIA